MKPSELPINTVIDTENYGMFIKLPPVTPAGTPKWHEMLAHCGDCMDLIGDTPGTPEDVQNGRLTHLKSSDEFFTEFTIVSLPVVVEETLVPKKNDMQTKVETFMIACEQEVKKYPELTTVQIRQLRIRLMVSELLGAKIPDRVDFPADDAGDAAFQEYEQTFDIYGFVADKSNELVASLLAGDLVGIADGIGDLLYVVIGTAAAYGINIQEVFDEIHRSNMSKTVWNEDTQVFTVVKDAGGKVLKPEGYSPPDIASIINRQIEAGKTV